MNAADQEIAEEEGHRNRGPTMSVEMSLGLTESRDRSILHSLHLHGRSWQSND
jgi:hypothetical protein